MTKRDDDRIDKDDKDNDEPRLRPVSRDMLGGGYAGAQTHGGRGHAMEPEGEIQGASYGRAWRDVGQSQESNELATDAPVSDPSSGDSDRSAERTGSRTDSEERRD